jgi:uncharacterized protein (TIGR02453 family)
MTFAGFSPEATAFYAALEADNSKDFWTARKADYETLVREPMAELVDELADEFGEGQLFRPYRDTRFSKDKTPYKTHQGAIVGPAPGVGYYVQLDADGLMAGGGFRSHGPADTARYRAAVDDGVAGPELAAIVGELESGGYTWYGDPVKTAPRGFSADHPRITLLRNRHLMVFKQLGTPRWLSTAQAKDEVAGVWRDLKPLADWVVARVGSG